MPSPNVSAVRTGAASAAALLVAGSLGPWASTPAGTVYGVDGLGWIGALAGAPACVALLARRRADDRWPDVAGCAIGIAGALSAVVIWSVVRGLGLFGSRLAETIASWVKVPITPDLGTSLEWGPYLVLLGSVGLIGACAISLTHTFESTPVRGPARSPAPRPFRRDPLE